MLIGRFLMIVPALGDCRVSGGQEGGAAGAGDLPDERPTLRCAPGQCCHYCRGADVLPGVVARAYRRALLGPEWKGFLVWQTR